MTLSALSWVLLFQSEIFFASRLLQSVTVCDSHALQRPNPQFHNLHSHRIASISANSTCFSEGEADRSHPVVLVSVELRGGNLYSSAYCHADSPPQMKLASNQSGREK